MCRQHWQDVKSFGSLFFRAGPSPEIPSVVLQAVLEASRLEQCPVLKASLLNGEDRVIHQEAFKNKEAPPLGTRESKEPERKRITLRGGGPTSEERRDTQEEELRGKRSPSPGSGIFTELQNLLPVV
ncbi:hypothetical protein NDU88_005787 [Pleurodeles waltl]|uniref:HTH myb-type domain-containing protein n=1 Tax=Pleurodeles waltl TaxID=8319 RepID=A0AAV7TDM3_PLEWA|nr:hypothetical protein NDU88_005787 [Pleurodeles waltl]